MDRSKLEWIMKNTWIGLRDKKYYLNGFYQGDFEDLCIGLSKLSIISPSDQEYFREVSVKTLINDKERRRVGKTVLRRVVQIRAVDVDISDYNCIQNEKTDLTWYDDDMNIKNFEHFKLPICGEKIVDCIRVDNKLLFV